MSSLIPEQRLFELEVRLKEACAEFKPEIPEAEFDVRIRESARHILALDNTLKSLGISSSLFPVRKLTPGLPNIAPELYQNRPKSVNTGRKESIAEFLLRVWKPYMKQELLTRQDLRILDPKAYVAAENWLGRQKAFPEGIYLPTIKQINDKTLVTVDEETYRKLSREAAKLSRCGDNSLEGKEIKRLAAASKRRLIKGSMPS